MARANAKTKPEDIERAERQALALELRRKRKTYDEIGTELGVSQSTAHRYVTEAIAEIKRDPAESLIDLELHTLDEIQAAIMPLAKTGDPAMIAAVIKLMQQRGKYYAIEQYAVNKLATNTKDLSAVDKWAAAMLGRDEADKAAAVEQSDEDIAADIAAMLAEAGVE